MTARWNSDLAWQQVGGSELDSVAGGYFALGNAGHVFDNTGGAARRTDIAVWGKFTATGATNSPAYVPIYALPLGEDGTTYGDGTASGSVVPNGYFIGNLNVTLLTAAGTAIGIGYLGSILPAKYRFGVSNQFPNTWGTGTLLYVAPLTIDPAAA